MRTVNINGHEVEIYDSGEDMPMLRYQKFNKFLMIDNEVGSTYKDYKRRSQAAYKYLKAGLTDKCLQELRNRDQAVYNAFMEYNPQGRAMAILVKSIDGEICDDYTSSGLDSVLKKLDKIGFPYGKSVETVNDVKKKLSSDYQNTSPESSKPQRWKVLNGIATSLKKCGSKLKRFWRGHGTQNR